MSDLSKYSARSLVQLIRSGRINQSYVEQMLGECEMDAKLDRVLDILSEEDFAEANYRGDS